MKIGVISDTHGCELHWAAAYEKFFQDADLIIHSGDVLYHDQEILCWRITIQQVWPSA